MRPQLIDGGWEIVPEDGYGNGSPVAPPIFGCSGVDEGDGFDCIGWPVAGNPRTRRLTDGEVAELWRRLRAGEAITLEERVHVMYGSLGPEALGYLRGIPQPLPPVTIEAERDWWGLLWPFLGLGAVIWWGMRPHKKRRA